MNPQNEEAEQLLASGQRDLTALLILRRDTESPLEIVLFHAQQAAEKFIKSVLALRGVSFRRTHDLVELHELATQNGITIPASRELLVLLGPYAVEFRYLGIKAPDVSPEEAVEAVKSLQSWASHTIKRAS